MYNLTIIYSRLNLRLQIIAWHREIKILFIFQYLPKNRQSDKHFLDASQIFQSLCLVSIRYRLC